MPGRTLARGRARDERCSGLSGVDCRAGSRDWLPASAQVGSSLAGQRARIRLDGQVMHVLTQGGILWRILPCPIPSGQRHKLQGVRLAGSEPVPPASTAIQRKVSSRGGIQIARQRIQVGLPHAGKIVTIELGDTSLRIIDDQGERIATVPRRSDGEISRFKAYGTRQQPR